MKAKIDEVLVQRFERKKTGANAHFVNKTMFYYREYVKKHNSLDENDRPRKRFKHYIQITEKAMRTVVNGGDVDASFSEWLGAKW